MLSTIVDFPSSKHSPHHPNTAHAIRGGAEKGFGRQGGGRAGTRGQGAEGAEGAEGGGQGVQAFDLHLLTDWANE